MFVTVKLTMGRKVIDLKGEIPTLDFLKQCYFQMNSKYLIA